MTPERWARLEELYHAARARPPGERAAFLAAECADDEAMRGDVESLLNEPESDGGFVHRSALVLPPHLLSDVIPSTMTGRTIGEYRLERLLGAGGMGEVYRARDGTLGRDVAIKILPRAFTSHPDRLARFEREARMLAALSHPNICGIYGTEEAEGIRLLVLELVEGETLSERLDKSRRRNRGAGLPLQEALTIGRQIADALEAAHERGIVHRDLKPDNIKVTPGGIVKVLDFGLAKIVGGEGPLPDLTLAPPTTPDGRREGAVIGTAAYMSPEQARGLTVDKRTDIWAFGCVLYEMLTGRVAFPGDTVSDTIAKILEREPDWSALPATTPAHIRRLLIRCLTKDPKQRLRDVGDVRIEIDSTGDPVAAVSPNVTGARPRWWAVTAGTVLVLIVASIWASWWWRGARPSIRSDLANATYTTLTNWEGPELDAGISADGKFVAFLAGPTGPFHVWIAQVGRTGSFRDLTPGTGDERNRLNRPVGFSADGSQVWLSGSPAGRRLRVVPFTGGVASLFLEDRAVSTEWSHDGTRLLYMRADMDGDPLFTADHTGGNPVVVLPGRAGEHNHFPTWSTDDQWIYYVHFVDEPFSADLWRIPSGGGTPTRLTHAYTDVRYPTPIDANTVLYVARAEDRTGPWLWGLDVQRRVTERVSVGVERYLSVAASGNGRRLVAAVGKSSAVLSTVPILDRIAELADVKPYAMPTDRALAPRFAANSLFYLSSSGSGDGLWRADGDRAVELWSASDGALLEPAAVSSDGQVAVAVRRQGTAHLIVISADGASRRSIADNLAVRGTAAWSPDSKWIVTGAKDARGSPGLFLIPTVGNSAPVRLATGEALDPVWSPRGDIIVYAGPLARGTAPLLAIRPDGRAVPLPPIRLNVLGAGCVRFLPDGSGVVYLVGPNFSQEFWLLHFGTNTVRKLALFANQGTTNSFDITPDGKAILFDRLRENSDIVLIDLPKK